MKDADIIQNNNDSKVDCRDKGKDDLPLKMSRHSKREPDGWDENDEQSLNETSLSLAILLAGKTSIP